LLAVLVSCATQLTLPTHLGLFPEALLLEFKGSLWKSWIWRAALPSGQMTLPPFVIILIPSGQESYSDSSGYHQMLMITCMLVLRKPFRHADY